MFYAFDVLEAEGTSLLRNSLEARRSRLKQILADSRVLISEPLPGSPAHIEREIRKLRLEGVIAKRRDSLYLPGQRSNAWVKVKFSPSQEFVIGGYTPSAANFDAVLVGYYDGKRLTFAGKVRAGFTPHLRAEVMRRIADRPARRCPFVNLPNSTGKSRWGEGITAEDMAAIRWVRPTVVVQVAFVEWTTDGLLRHSQFVGLRDDKPAREVQREAN